jgi:hypothetical protein
MTRARKRVQNSPAKPRKAPAGSEGSTASLDWRKAKRVALPNLQPNTTAISKEETKIDGRKATRPINR